MPSHQIFSQILPPIRMNPKKDTTPLKKIILKYRSKQLIKIVSNI